MLTVWLEDYTLCLLVIDYLLFFPFTVLFTSLGSSIHLIFIYDHISIYLSQIVMLTVWLEY